MEFKTFKSEKDQKFYFHLQSDDEKVILRSKAYSSSDARDNGIESVIKNAVLSSNYEKHSSPEGHYFDLKATNGEVIGNSPIFSSAKELETTIEDLLKASLNYGPTPLETFTSMLFGKGKSGQENRPEKDVIKSGSFNKMTYESFRSGNDGKYYFHFLDPNGKIFLRSEAYETEVGCDNGIQAVIKNADNAELYEWKVSNNGKHYFNLLSPNSKIIATSMLYDNKDDLKKSAGWLGGAGFLAGLAGLGGASVIKKSVTDIKTPKTDIKNSISESTKEIKKEVKEVKPEIKKTEIKPPVVKTPEVKKVVPPPVVPPVVKKDVSKESAMEKLEKKLGAKKVDPIKPPVTKVETTKKSINETQSTAKAAANYSKEKQTPIQNTTSSTATILTEPKKKKGFLGRFWPLLLLFLLIPLIWFLAKGCGTDMKNKLAGAKDKTTKTMTDAKDKVEDAISTEPLGPTGEAMGFEAGTREDNMANFLSDPSSGSSKRFTFEDIKFSRNGARLSGTARAGLDKMVKVLDEYPDSSVDIYGYVGTNESSSFRGGKELTLGDVRAREIFNYLSSRGISKSRMNYEGSGRSDEPYPEIEINK